MVHPVEVIMKSNIKREENAIINGDADTSALGAFCFDIIIGSCSDGNKR